MKDVESARLDSDGSEVGIVIHDGIVSTAVPSTAQTMGRSMCPAKVHLRSRCPTFRLSWYWRK